MTIASSEELLRLAVEWDDEGVRIARFGITRNGVDRHRAATAAHCFTIANELRALSGASS